MKTATELVKVESETIAITPDLIKRYLCPNATDKELFLAASIAKSYGLNPFKRELHIIKYGNAPASVVVGYEVYLKRAERTGKLNGWKVSVSHDKQTADITIHRKDWDKPFEWTVYRSEFDKGQANWKSMPAFMLKKVAMAQGFRLCFPDEMGGLPYLPEEINLGSSEALPTGEALEEHKDPPPPKSDTPGTDALARDMAQGTLVDPDADIRAEVKNLVDTLAKLENKDSSDIVFEVTSYKIKTGAKAGEIVGFSTVESIKHTDTVPRLRWAKDKLERRIREFKEPE